MTNSNSNKLIIVAGSVDLNGIFVDRMGFGAMWLTNSSMGGKSVGNKFDAISK